MWQTSGVVRRFFETGVLEQIGTRAGAKHIKDRAGREHGGEEADSDPAVLPSSGSSHRLDATPNWDTAGKVAAGFIVIAIHKEHSDGALFAPFGGQSFLPPEPTIFWHVGSKNLFFLPLLTFISLY
jgi:hypothetical protein